MAKTHLRARDRARAGDDGVNNENPAVKALHRLWITLAIRRLKKGSDR